MPTTQKRQRLTDQTREITDSENIYDQTVSTNCRILLPGKWERLPQAVPMIQERCSQPEVVAICLEAVLVHVNACRVSVAGTVNDPHDRSSDQLQLSYLGSVCDKRGRGNRKMSNASSH